MKKLILLLGVSVILGSFTPVLAGYMYNDGDLETAYEPNKLPIRLNRTTLIALNKVTSKSTFFILEDTNQYVITWVSRNASEVGPSQLNAYISEVEINEKKKCIKFHLEISERGFNGRANVLVGNKALTQKGKQFFEKLSRIENLKRS